MSNFVRVNISVSPDTLERLKQYACENHLSVSGSITQWIWRENVKSDQIRGQLSLKDRK